MRMQCSATPRKLLVLHDVDHGKAFLQVRPNGHPTSNVGRPGAQLEPRLRGDRHMSPIKKISGAVVAGVMTIGVAAGPADAQTKQDGLVNVVVGDVTILEDVNIAAAVGAAVQACGIDILDVNAVAAVL